MRENQVKDSNTSLEVAPQVNSNVFRLNTRHPAKAFAAAVPRHAACIIQASLYWFKHFPNYDF